MNHENGNAKISDEEVEQVTNEILDDVMGMDYQDSEGNWIERGCPDGCCNSSSYETDWDKRYEGKIVSIIDLVLDEAPLKMKYLVSPITVPFSKLTERATKGIRNALK